MKFKDILHISQPIIDRLQNAIFTTPVEIPQGEVSMSDIKYTKESLDGFVISPLDRNTGKPLVICPYMFWQELKNSFIEDPHYKVVPNVTEDIILSRLHAEY